MKTIKFNSITDVLNFINTHEVTEGYKAHMASKKGLYSFTKTNDFNEAMNLLKHGWESGAQKLNTQLKTIKTGDGYKTKQFYGVAGYQCSVPRYLQGIPTNMVNSKRVVTKNKVVNITKDICYNALWDADKMIEQGVKFVELVNKIESTGTRCNVFVMLGVQRYNDKVCFKIKIKDWFLDKTQDTARRYNTWIDVFSRDEETGMELSIDGYKSVRVQEVLKETEKAVQVVLSTGDVVGSIKGWRTWIPKSVIA